MTLIELLIVLALLGGLATLALTGVGEMSARNRVDITRQRLELIRQAVVGDGVTAGRFIADMGRLPMVQTADEGLTLDELWNETSGIAYGTASVSPSWPESISGLPATVELDCGWNGPYVLLSGDELYDGFGNEFLVANIASPAAEADWDDAAAVSVGDTVHGVISLGLNNTYGGSGWAQEDRSVVFDELMSETSLTVMVKARNAGSEPSVWTAPVDTQVWNNTDLFNTGDIVADSALAEVFRCRVDGVSGTPEPVPPGDANWEYLGTVNECGHCLNRLRVALFVPDIDQGTRNVGWKKKWIPEEEAFAPETTLTGLTPGIRKLYVYGFLDDGVGNTANARASGAQPQTIELNPGANFVTVYLAEKL